ncbi:MAG: GON domain-containing protein, partial [Pseudonocardiaceae bacterium]
TPREYLDLAATGENQNFSQYTAGGASPGTNVRTSFTKVRIDPATLTVDIGDLTFATSTGKLQHSSVTRGPSSPYVTSMPYGVGMTCANPGSPPNGVGNIDMHGTPFTVNDTFQVRSYAGTGSATVSDDKQKVELLVSGYCGWIAAEPAIDPGYNPQPGNYRLNLACAPRDTATVQPGRYCLTLS